MKKGIIITIIILIISISIGYIFLKKKDYNPGYTVYEKKASIVKDDGWYYYFYLNGVKENNQGEVKDINYFFDAINLKYETLPEYGYMDETINENDEKVKIFRPSYPSLSNSLKEKDGIKESEEILMIDNYFDQKNFTHSITINDLSDLKVYNFDKELIVELFNKMIEKEYSSHITHFTVYQGEYRHDEEKDGYMWHTSVLPFRTGLDAVYIDIIYHNQTYLSDLIKENKANAKQREIYENIEKIDKYIISNQTVELEDTFKELSNNKDYQRLFKILATYDDGWID